MKRDGLLAALALGTVLVAGGHSQGATHQSFGNDIGNGIEGRADFLAGFVLFGADYRGNKIENCPVCWEPVSKDPLTFHRNSDGMKMTITDIDRCRYELTYGTSDSATKTSIVDFKQASEIDLSEGLFDGSWLTAKTGNAFVCEKVEKNGMTWSNCGGQSLFYESLDGKTILARTHGGGTGEDIGTAVTFFFNQVCQRR
ncbi:UNVERIFIED_ORG: hypothetical protein J2W19_004680 [Shinella zoogloeoides]|nr:hypothetical protein [Shinella zoogloeoides]